MRKRKGGATRRPGRPSKLNEQVLAKFVEGRRLALSIRDAALAAGIDDRTHHNWMKQGREDSENGRNTLHASYFRQSTIAGAEGKRRVRRLAWRIAKNPNSTVADAHRAKIALALEARAEGCRRANAEIRYTKARTKALRAAAEVGLTPQQQGQEAGGGLGPTDFSLLSDEEVVRYRFLAERVRTAFTSVTPEEVMELQALLRKARKVEPTANTDTTESG